MKNIITAFFLLVCAAAGSCQQKTNANLKSTACSSNPRTVVPASLQGNWMYGKFSMKEYWSQHPSTYLGNAMQFAIAFRFNADGTYEQYFTSGSVMGGVVTYQQSVTKGTVVTDTETGTITTYPCSSHYKRMNGNRVVEDRDLLPRELSGKTSYTFRTGSEANGTKAVYLTMQGTTDPLTFLQRF